MLKTALPLAFATGLFAVLAQADLRETLDQQQTNLDVNQSQLDSTLSMHQALVDNLKTVRAQREAIEAERDELTQKLTKLVAHIDAQSHSLDMLVLQLGRQRDDTRTLFAQAWRLNPRLSWRSVLAPEEPSHIARQLAWLRHMAAKQQAAILALERLRTKQTELVAQSRVDLEEYARVENALRTREEELRRLERLEREKQKQMEDFITDLRGNQAQLAENVQELRGVIRGVGRGKSRYDDDSDNFISGLLPWPFDGKIAEFGNPKGKTKKGARLARGGVLIVGERATEVRSVHRGRVVFSGHLKGWGATVVVRHGRDYLSVYAYTEQLAKAAGDFVEAGETLAVLSDFRARSAVQAPVLYFALYRSGKSIDPRQWLSRPTH